MPISTDAGLPSGLTPRRRTPEFTEATLPDALRKDHSTRPGVWGVINVIEGRLRYSVPSKGATRLLDPSTTGIIEPAVEHHVEPDGPVRFFVEFWS